MVRPTISLALCAAVLCASPSNLTAFQGAALPRPKPGPETTFEKVQKIPPAVRQARLRVVGTAFVNKLRQAKGKAAEMAAPIKAGLEKGRDKIEPMADKLAEDLAKVVDAIESNPGLQGGIDKVMHFIEKPEALWNKLMQSSAAFRSFLNKAKGQYRSISFVSVGTNSAVVGYDVPVPIPPCPPGIAYSLDGKRSVLFWSGGLRASTSVQSTKGIQIGLWTRDPGNLNGSFWGLFGGTRMGTTNGFSFLWDYTGAYRGFTVNTKVGVNVTALELGVTAGASTAIPYESILLPR